MVSSRSSAWWWIAGFSGCALVAACSLDLSELSDGTTSSSVGGSGGAASGGGGSTTGGGGQGGDGGQEDWGCADGGPLERQPGPHSFEYERATVWKLMSSPEAATFDSCTNLNAETAHIPPAPVDPSNPLYFLYVVAEDGESADGLSGCKGTDCTLSGNVYTIDNHTLTRFTVKELDPTSGCTILKHTQISFVDEGDTAVRRLSVWFEADPTNGDCAEYDQSVKDAGNGMGVLECRYHFDKCYAFDSLLTPTLSDG